MQTQLKIVPLKKYLLKLEKQLQILPPVEREDILRELESQLFEEIQAGEHPEALLERLGKPTDYARPFLNDYLEEMQQHGHLQDHLRLIWKKALIPGLALMLGWVMLMLANTSYIFGDLISHAGVSLGESCRLMLFSLPAIVVIALPFLVLWAVPLYLFSLRSMNPRQVLKRSRVYVIVLLIGLSSTALDYLIQDQIVPPANRHTVAMLKDMMQAKQQAECHDNCPPPVVFSDQPDVRSLSVSEAKAYLDKYATQGKMDQGLWRDYYIKFSIPLANLAFALFGLMTASLMLSGMFHPYYTLIAIGAILPLGLWYNVYSFAQNDRFAPLLSAFMPDLVLAGVALLFLVGLILPGPRPETVFQE